MYHRINWNYNYKKGKQTDQKLFQIGPNSATKYMYIYRVTEIQPNMLKKYWSRKYEIKNLFERGQAMGISEWETLCI